MEQKNIILNIISALTVLNDDKFSNLKKRYGLSSLFNSSNNTYDFLIELIKVTVGWEELKNEAINFLTYNLNTIEASIKIALKELLKEIFICSINPSIPDYLFSTGVNIPISSIDWLKTLKTDPESEVGNLIYGNGNNDLNVVLYNAIQSGQENWKNIIVIKYITSATINGRSYSDVFNITINSAYEEESFNTFINDFIDSIALFSIPLVTNRILDNLFGIISLRQGKTLAELKDEETISSLFEKYISLPNEDIDDSYFNFNTIELQQILDSATQKKQGIRKQFQCDNVLTQININNLSYVSSSLTNESTYVEIKETLNNTFETLVLEITADLNPLDRKNTVLELYSSFIKGIIIGILQLFFSPKLMLLIRYYINTATETQSFKTAQDFLLENRAFIQRIIRNVILPKIMSFLIEILGKYLKRLAIQEKIKRIEEKNRFYQLQMKSLSNINNLL